MLFPRYTVFIAFAIAIYSCKAQQSSDCSNPAFQDSLFKKFIIEKAYHYDYMFPEWQAYCDSLLSFCDNSDRTWQLKAMPYFKKGNYESAYKYLNKAVELNAARWLPYRAFMKVIFLKDYEGAIYDLEDAEKLFPGTGIMDHSLEFYHGLCLLCLGEYAKSKQFFERDIGRQKKQFGENSVHFNSLLYYGILNYQLKDLDEAQKNLKKCLSTYVLHPEANYYYGLLLAYQNKKVEARIYLGLARNGLVKGYTMNEDNEIYVNYPFQVSMQEVDDALERLK